MNDYHRVSCMMLATTGLQKSLAMTGKACGDMEPIWYRTLATVAEECMSLITIKADAAWSGKGPQIQLHAGTHQWLVDQPQSAGGLDSGPTPLELQLAALGSCLTTLGFAFAAHFGVELRGLSVATEGDLDPDGYQGIAEVPFGFQQIRFKVVVDSPSPQDKIDALLAHIKKICPIRNTLQGVTVVDAALSNA